MVITSTAHPFAPYNYLGPGNSLDGIPINQADEIASRHDLAYQALLNDDHITPEQFHLGVINADRRAVEEFFTANPQLDGVLSGLLLGVKSVTEFILQLIGRQSPLYPNRYGTSFL